MNDRRNPFAFALALDTVSPGKGRFWLLVDKGGNPVDCAHQARPGLPLYGLDGIMGKVPGCTWTMASRVRILGLSVLAEEAGRIDREYLCAIRRLDWEEGQRLVAEAAVRAGFGPHARFHGTDSKFTVFTPGDDGICFVDSVAVAKDYGDTVMACYLRMRKPHRMTYRKWLMSHDPSFEALQAAGKDGIIVSGFQQGEDRIHDANSNMFVVFSPEQVRSAALLVRDDAGNIVLPSRRFAPGPDIRGAVEETKARCAQDRETPRVEEEAGISP